MHIDCDRCPGRPRSCDGCMMSVLIPAPRLRSSDDGVPGPGGPATRDLDEIRAAIEVLVTAELVAPSARRAPIVVGGLAQVGEQGRRRAG